MKCKTETLHSTFLPEEVKLFNGNKVWAYSSTVSVSQKSLRGIERNRAQSAIAGHMDYPFIKHLGIANCIHVTGLQETNLSHYEK